MFIAIQAYLKKQEKSLLNNLTLHLKKLEKEEQTKPKVNRRKQIIKIRAEINEIETKKTIAKGDLRSIESFILHIRKLKFRRGDLANVTCLFVVVFKFPGQEPCGVAQN